MTHLLLLIAILIPYGPRPFIPSDSTWVIQAYSYSQPYTWQHGYDDKRNLPGPCLWTYYSDGRLVVHLRWDYDCDGVIDGSDLGYFGLEYNTRWNLSDFAMFAEAYMTQAEMEVE